jgi:hypothetical protein
LIIQFEREMGLVSHFVHKNVFLSEFSDGSDTVLDAIKSESRGAGDGWLNQTENESHLSEALSVADGAIGRRFASSSPSLRKRVRGFAAKTEQVQSGEVMCSAWNDASVTSPCAASATTERGMDSSPRPLCSLAFAAVWTRVCRGGIARAPAEKGLRDAAGWTGSAARSSAPSQMSEM